MKPQKNNTNAKKLVAHIKGAFGVLADKAYERKMRHQQQKQHAYTMDPAMATIPLYSFVA